MYEFLGPREKDGRALVDILYRAHCAEMLTLEAQAAKDASDAGRRMREGLFWKRVMLLSWIISSVSHMRTRFGLIDADRPILYHLVADVFTEHLRPLLHTPELAKCQSVVLSLEEAEVCCAVFDSASPQ